MLASGLREIRATVSSLVREAVRLRATEDKASFRDCMGKLYQETLAVKVQHGQAGKKVQEYLETVARRAGWQIGDRPLNTDLVEEAVTGVLMSREWLEECLTLMRGGAGSRERSPAFLAEVLAVMAPGWASGGAGARR